MNNMLGKSNNGSIFAKNHYCCEDNTTFEQHFPYLRPRLFEISTLSGYFERLNSNSSCSERPITDIVINYLVLKQTVKQDISHIYTSIGRLLFADMYIPNCEHLA